ncbi:MULTISPECIES: non-heme iron oxygenase ferredoxin subunit [Sphingomonas]|uniref:non-heme iron oxygenase ferredoxin subunit n=1 Tax=Sphingomonas TaxID=13687 RepID=UPI002413C439|nr:non-heme iron oxygenase ferredoxin subunit [Sphingomonas echinoides]
MQWLEVTGGDDLAIDDVMRIESAAGPIAVYRLEDGYFATQDICTHAVASLAEGFVEDGRIECPLHAGTFCIRTGKARTLPATIPLTTYPVRVDDGRILVGVPDGTDT